MVPATRRDAVLVLSVVIVALLSASVRAQEAQPPANLFQNAGFESGTTSWGTSSATGTSAEFNISAEDAAEGEHSVFVKLRTAEGWGYQFGQRVAAGQKGKTYTFAVLAKAVGAPVILQLEIERAGGDYARATRSGPTLVGEGAWKEIYTTFTVAADFPEGWYAYVSCTQAGARFRLDAFRLYEGEYVPFAQGAEKAPAAAPVQELAPAAPKNLFANDGFEMGTVAWNASRATGTEAEFTVAEDVVAEGKKSALIKLGAVSGWGLQFGQGLPAGKKGKTYTFAVLGRSVSGTVSVQLEIERPATPWDRAARGQTTALTDDKWTDVHTTFTVADDFPEGWSAYLSCSQPNASFRLDAFRLYEGEYAPLGQEVKTVEKAPAAAAPVQASAPAASKNLFANDGFEQGTAAWNASRETGTEADFKVVEDVVVEGKKSALIKLGAVAGWGLQFGQRVPAGKKGKTFTFAVMGRSVSGAVSVQLEIERPADPWDRAARSQPVTLTDDKWTDVHTTFTVADDFPEGWSAYLSCSQPNASFRLDAFRLYEGEYAPFGQEVKKTPTAAAPIQEPAPAPEPAAPVLQPLPPAVRLFDTRAPLAGTLAADAPAHLDGWTEVAQGEAAHAFAGDAVLLNNHVVLAARKGAAGAELYSVGAQGLKLRAVLSPVVAGGVKGLASVSVKSSTPEATVLDIAFTTAAGAQAAVGCELRVGQPFVRTTAGPGVEALRIEAPSRFAVLPDFFADDIVLDATRVSGDQAELPSENFLLHMLPDRDAIVAAVWTTRDQDVHVELAGQGADRVMKASQVVYGKEGQVNVAVLEGHRLWHVHGVAAADVGKVVELNWQAPFTAHWRVDWTRHDGLIDSWTMLVASGGGYRKPSFIGREEGVPGNRERWTTVLGSFKYPCWMDAQGKGYLEPMGSLLRFVGPALIYPIDRIKATPLDVYTVTDVVRETLGVGPCQYILDVESQKTERQGVATCATRDQLDAIYGRGGQTAARAEVEKALADVVTFITHIRGRIRHYQDFSHEILAYLGEQKKAHPELTTQIAQLEELARTVDAHVAARETVIKTPEFAADLANQFRATLLGYEGPDALAKCKKFTAAWVEIGGNQDNLVGECRWAVKVLRQRAGLIMAENPAMGDIAREIRKRCQESLRNPASYENPTH